MGKPYSADILPARSVVPVILSTDALPNGPCISVWVGTAGNMNITTVDGVERDDFPAIVGLNQIRCTHIRPGASATAASNIWAMYN